MKYEKEINNMFEICFPKATWMTDEEYDQSIKDTLSILKIDKHGISESIQIGVENGYSVDFQISIIKSILKK